MKYYTTKELTNLVKNQLFTAILILIDDAEYTILHKLDTPTFGEVFTFKKIGNNAWKLVDNFPDDRTKYIYYTYNWIMKLSKNHNLIYEFVERKDDKGIIDKYILMFQKVNNPNFNSEFSIDILQRKSLRFVFKRILDDKIYKWLSVNDFLKLNSI